MLNKAVFCFSPQDKFSLHWFGFLSLFGILVGRMANKTIIQWVYYGCISFHKSPIVAGELEKQFFLHIPRNWPVTYCFNFRKISAASLFRYNMSQVCALPFNELAFGCLKFHIVYLKSRKYSSQHSRCSSNVKKRQQCCLDI